MADVFHSCPPRLRCYAIAPALRSRARGRSAWVDHKPLFVQYVNTDNMYILVFGKDVRPGPCRRGIVDLPVKRCRIPIIPMFDDPPVDEPHEAATLDPKRLSSRGLAKRLAQQRSRHKPFAGRSLRRHSAV